MSWNGNNQVGQKDAPAIEIEGQDRTNEDIRNDNGTVQDNTEYYQNKVVQDDAHDAEDDPNKINFANDAQVTQGNEQSSTFLWDSAGDIEIWSS